MTDEDVGGRGERERERGAKRCGEERRRRKGRKKTQRVENKGCFSFFGLFYQNGTVFSCWENMKTAEDCFVLFFYPADGESLLSLPSGFGWTISGTPPLAQQLTASSCCTVWPAVVQVLSHGNTVRGPRKLSARRVSSTRPRCNHTLTQFCGPRRTISLMVIFEKHVANWRKTFRSKASAGRRPRTAMFWFFFNGM